MKFLRTPIILIFVVSELGYVSTVKNNETNSISALNRDTLCTTPKCVMKCCPLGKYRRRIRRKGHRHKTFCDYFDNTTRDFASLVKEIFTSYPEISELNLTIKAGIFETNKTFKHYSVPISSHFNLHLTEYPEVILDLPNDHDRWLRIKNNRFCWDHKVGRFKNVFPEIWVIWPESDSAPRWPEFLNPGGFSYENQDSRLISTAVSIGLLLTCFFLLVVFVVYALLPELRNRCGLILMAYVASLFSNFQLMFVMRSRPYDVFTCKSLTFLIYYFVMASFCWMNVMSYDIWRTFRVYAKAPAIHHRCKHFKFLMYCLYAFGLPLAMTVALIILNEVDFYDMPWVITPKIPDENGCFFGGAERFLYMYVPMLILNLCNWVFYVMTAISMWRLSRGTAVLDSAGKPLAHRTYRRRLMMYLKLSAVMGLHWVLVVARSMYPGYNLWLISELYNILIGLTIFLIFVCKRSILRKLKERYLKKSKCWSGQNNEIELQQNDATRT